MDDSQLIRLLHSLTEMPHETEWLEFKVNRADPQQIGEYLSALSNSAALLGVEHGYLVWGVKDKGHVIVGTSFSPRDEKVGNQELENWLATQLAPRIDFRIHEFEDDGKRIVIFEVPKAIHTPIRFKGREYLRIGSCKQNLLDFPEKERELWSCFSRMPFEKGIAKKSVSSDEVLSLIDYPSYFDLTGQRLPDNRAGILDRLARESVVIPVGANRYDITNFGALLLAKDLSAFERIRRKAPRVIVYSGKNKVETIREQIGAKGYAIAFEGLIDFVNNLLPQNEEIRAALRTEVKMYPEVAIRELVANALIHQDFNITGTGPTVEIFTDRIEITNPGLPLVETLRFIGEQPISRNEDIASFMRRINICEERGSGIIKVVKSAELYQLPAPDFRTTTSHTKAILFAHKDFTEMDKQDKIRACYQHACLCHVSNEMMTNSSLRERFSIKKQNYSIASRIISDTIDAELIKPYDPDNKAKKHAKYVPFWF